MRKIPSDFVGLDKAEQEMLREYAFQELTDWDQQVFQTDVAANHFLRRALRALPWEEFSRLPVRHVISGSDWD